MSSKRLLFWSLTKVSTLELWHTSALLKIRNNYNLSSKHCGQDNIDPIRGNLWELETSDTVFCFLGQDTNNSQTFTKSIQYALTLSSSQALLCCRYQTDRNFNRASWSLLPTRWALQNSEDLSSDKKTEMLFVSHPLVLIDTVQICCTVSHECGRCTLSSSTTFSSLSLHFLSSKWRISFHRCPACVSSC